MAEVHEDDIYNEILIFEVKSRPALYDRSNKEYGDTPTKAILWEEVTMKVFSTVWQQLPPVQKMKAEKLVQKRWKNLRTCFCRELKSQQLDKLEKNNKRRRPYIHFEDLLFLLPFVQDKEHRGNSEAQENDEVRWKSRVRRRNPTSRAVVKGEEVEIMLHPESIEQEEPEVYTPVVGPPKKRKSYEENQTDIFSGINGTDSAISDSEKHFALSLVPLLKALAPHQKLEAQIQILQVFRNFHNSFPEPVL